jgi:hypothetical protein
VYDKYGNTLSETYYGIDEQIVENREGTAVATWVYDEKGNPLKTTRFDRKKMPLELTR